MAPSEKEKVKKFRSLIAESSAAVVTAHVHPDGDAVGSTVAMASFLRGAGLDATVILPQEPDAKLAFLKEGADVLSFEDSGEEALKRIRHSGLIVCLDCNAFDRTGDMGQILSSSPARKVLIDHHPDPDSGAFDLVFSECGISSASELLFWLLMDMPDTGGDPGKLTPVASRALMAGMTTDTNNFANSVYPSTFRMASMLLSAGVDRDGLLSLLYNSYRENRLRAMGHVLEKEMTVTEKGAAYMILTDGFKKQFSLEEGETDGFVNLPLAIRNVRMSILAKMDVDHYRISIRSKKGVSANEFSKKYFNGGGHELASGGKLLCPKDIRSCEKESVAAYIEKVCDEFLR